MTMDSTAKESTTEFLLDFFFFELSKKGNLSNQIFEIQ